MNRRFAFRASCFVLLCAVLSNAFSSAHAEEGGGQAVFAIAMHGAPKYAPAFTHFDYVKPDAPQGGSLRVGVTGSFDSLNPFIVRGNPAYGLSLGSMSMVFEPLMARSWDEPFTLYGLIAETVEVPEDRSSITFNLRSSAHWQDGKPLTADDVLFSFITLRDQGRPNHRMYYKKVATVEKLGALRVRFTFKPNEGGSYDREMPLIMGLMPVLPKHDWQNRVFNQTAMRVPVGSGPYRIEKVEPGRSVTYVRDPHYWGQGLATQGGQYNFASVRVDYYRDDAIALQAFKAGAFDLRREADPNKWATAYDTPAVKEGRLVLTSFAHHRPEPINGFILNTRRDLFKDKALRRAVAYAFDFGWINRNLFHGLTRRSESFFPNSELATDIHQALEGEEKAVLEKYRAQLDPDILTAPVELPTTDGSEESLRRNLLKASHIFKTNGYVTRDEELFTPQGAPVAFEVLLGDPSEEKIALQWARALKTLGIKVTVRTADSAQYQARLASFDYDVTVGKWTNSLSPGNEQSLFWSSGASRTQGSRNYAGVTDPVVDALAAAIPSSLTREELVATTRALDRVLLAGAYVVPFYHLGADQIAYGHTIKHPSVTPLYGPIVETWWEDKVGK